MKNLYQTRWELSPQRIVLYPQRMFSLLAIFIVLLGIGLLVLMHYQHIDVSSLWSLSWLWIVPVVLFALSSRNALVFDNQAGMMYKKWLGVITTQTVPFDQLHSINVVNQAGIGGYSYKLFRKNARYGRGITVSSGYSKADDANAVAFVNEVVPQIHAFLDQHDQLTNQVPADLGALKYFKADGGQYIVRAGGWSNVFYAVLFLILSVWITFGVPEKTMGIYIAQGFFLVLTVIFVNGAFIKFTFDPNAGTVKRTALFSYMNREFHLDQFLGVQTVRHTTNMIYSHTSVHLHFLDSKKSHKAVDLQVASFYLVKKVDRFVQEFHHVMPLPESSTATEEQF